MNCEIHLAGYKQNYCIYVCVYIYVCVCVYAGFCVKHFFLDDHFKTSWEDTELYQVSTSSRLPKSLA